VLPLFVHFSYYIPTLVHTFIRYIHPLHSLSFTLVFLIAVRSEEGLHLGAEPRIELGTALQQPNALPSELSRTLTELRLTLLSYSHPVKLSRTLLSYAAPHLRYASPYTVKKVSGFPVPSRDATYQTLPGRE
jgi:hypothetical protein